MSSDHAWRPLCPSIRAPSTIFNQQPPVWVLPAATADRGKSSHMSPMWLLRASRVSIRQVGFVSVRQADRSINSAVHYPDCSMESRCKCSFPVEEGDGRVILPSRAAAGPMIPLGEADTSRTRSATFAKRGECLSRPPYAFLMSAPNVPAHAMSIE